jgi:environmental stress-induced protein Ves
MPTFRMIRAGDVPSQPWRNGGGLTRELLTWPASAPAWRLRISLAEVAADGPFSRFPGIERWFAVIDGAGVRLALDGEPHELRPGHQPLRFGGELPVNCALIDGPTTDLNLMHAGGRARMECVRSGVGFASPLPMRGLFTRLAGAWHAPGAAAVPLPARCLLWLEQAAGEPWTFVADDPAVPAPALALAYAP